VVIVAVRDIDLVRGNIDRHVGGTPEACRILAVGLRTGLADLHHELAVARELQNLSVVLTIAREPDDPFASM
jgi:hypothetical protein